MTTAHTTPAAGQRLRSIQQSSKQFGQIKVIPDFTQAGAQLRERGTGRGSPMLRQLAAAANQLPRSHKGPPLPRSATEHTDGNYAGAELAQYQGRPGVAAANALPSRMGDLLHYRDGRVEHINSKKA